MAPEGWEVTTLGELITFSRGGTSFLKKEYTETGVPVLAKGDVKPMGRIEHTGRFADAQAAERSGYYQTRPGDILVTTRDLTQAADFLGLIAQVPTDQPYLVNQGSTIFRIDESRLDARFLVYWAATDVYREHIKSHYVGSTQIHLRQGDLFSAPLWLPSMPEQKAIVSMLASLDNKIDLNQATSQRLHAMAASIFRAWFIEFLPVRGRALGIQARSGIPEEVYEQLPSQLENSPIGDVPQGWAVVPLTEMIEISGGGTPKRGVEAYWDGEVPWFSIRDAPPLGDVWVLSTQERITELGVSSSAAKVLPAGTTIISARGTVGQLAMNAVPMAINQSCYGIRGVQGVGDSFTYFMTFFALADLRQRTHGSVFDTITRSTFEMLMRARPTQELLTAFETLTGPMLALIRENRRESQRLAATRDRLLPDLVKGWRRIQLEAMDHV